MLGGPITRPPPAWPAVAIVGAPEIRGGWTASPGRRANQLAASRAYRPFIGQKYAVGGMHDLLALRLTCWTPGRSPRTWRRLPRDFRVEPRAWREHRQILLFS